MLLVHHHPLNKDRHPKVLSSYQTIYPRTGVDINSRWIVQWDEGIKVQGMLMTDMENSGQRGATAVLQCQEGDLAIECTFCLFLSSCLVRLGRSIMLTNEIQIHQLMRRLIA